MSVHNSRTRNGTGRARRVAFYDLDGTLVGLNLVHATLYILANLGEWGGRAGYLLSFVGRVPRLYLAERQDRRILNAELFAVLKGVSRDRLEALGEEYCERVLLGHLYPQALELLEANRAVGIEPVLVTGSPSFIVAPLARALDITEYASNRLAISRGRATGRLLEPVMAGSEKAAWCENYAAARGLRLADCWGYADSFYDLPFLAAMGHPVAVNPDRRLKATAMSRHWPVVRFDGESGSAGMLATMRRAAQV
jgi:HAD superfamily hydrolase (TIGR01490 family)